MKINTSELTGAALDWAVAKCLEQADCVELEQVNAVWAVAVPELGCYYEPSTDWGQGGPIIEQNKIDVMWGGDRWSAYTMTPDGQQLITEGDTPLLAAMRGFVAANLGNEIDLPADLALDCLIYETGDE